MSTLQVRLNGTPIRGRIDGLESFSVTYSRDEQTGAIQKAYTNELKFFDDGFNLIFNTLVASQQGLYRFIKVQIWDECCNDFVYQDFIIKGDSVDYCTGDCFVTARMTREDADERIYECFKRTPITTDLENPDGSFKPTHWLVDPNSGITIPKVPYCNEFKPVLLFWLILFFGMGLVLIITILNFLTLGALKDIKEWLQLNLIGCGRLHPSPRIVDYIEQASAYCGCTGQPSFWSSFLSDPNSFYTSTLFVNAPIKPGTRNTNVRYIVENRPRQTITEFLNMVASDFNANWWIENGKLYMERKDYYLTAPVLLDAIAESKKGNILNGACFKYNQGTLYASIDIRATADPHEICGNNSLDFTNVFFDFVKIYNNPAGWDSWLDIKKVQLSYAPARFRDDDSPKSGLDSFPIPALLNLYYGSVVKASSRYLIIAQDEFTIHKYYEWDNTSPNQAQARREQMQQWDGSINQFINLPFGTPNPRYKVRYDPNQSVTPANGRNIYTDFHSINDPTQNPYRFWDYEIEAKMNCVMVRNLSVNKTVRMQTPYGTTVLGKINTIIANFGERTIRITGEF